MVNNKKSRLSLFFSKPIVGIIGSIASVIGIPLAIYFYLVTQEKPDLIYFVHPAKASVVRTDQSSQLSVQFDGRSLKSDVTAIQIAFWNAGKKPIKYSDILSPLIIKTKNKEKILKVNLRKKSRDIVHIDIDSSKSANGEVKITWNILEQNDGGVLQIIYAGNETVEIKAHAILVGQSKINELQYGKKLLSPSEEYNRQQEFAGKSFYYIMIGMGLIMVIQMSIFIIRRRNKGIQIEKFEWFTLVMGVFILSSSILLFIRERPLAPPFGF